MRLVVRPSLVEIFQRRRGLSNADGRGPAWVNSLFEDNAEFGLGMRLALDQQLDFAEILLKRLESSLGTDLVDAILSCPQSNEAEIAQQRERMTQLKQRLGEIPGVRCSEPDESG